jgi:hypothetical protein
VIAFARKGTVCESSKHCDGIGACVECFDASDCVDNGLCTSGVCYPASCGDGIMNGTETSSDCGGDCPPCADGEGCAVGQDCESGICSPATNTCAAPSCIDGIKNGIETDVDCGGGCYGCNDWLGCLLDTDCVSNACNQILGTCRCGDGMQNGPETGLDCGGGGSLCQGCLDGGSCQFDTDCAGEMPGACHNSVCRCSDGFVSAGEAGVDCVDTPIVGACLNCSGYPCSISGTCKSNVCMADGYCL